MSENWIKSDLTTLIVGQKYWVYNGRWTFKVIRHTEKGLKIHIYATNLNHIISYDTFLDVRVAYSYEW